MKKGQFTYAVIGTGGIGGYYGARLAEHGNDVHFLLRSDYDAVKRDGLSVDSVRGDIRLEKVNAYRSSADMPKADVALVCIKTTGNAALPDILRPILKEGTLVILVQNGLGMEQALSSALPGVTVAGATAFICSFRTGPGHISHTAYGELTLAPFVGGLCEGCDGGSGGGLCEGSGEGSVDGGPCEGCDGNDGGGDVGDCADVSSDRRCAVLRQVAEDLESAGVPTSLMPSLKLMRWKKLVWNIPYNGLCAARNAKTDVLTFTEPFRSEVIALMEEVVAAADSCGAHIDHSFIDRMVELTEQMAPYYPSMYLDHAAGRPMELETMYANPIAEAARHGFDMARTAALLRELEQMES